MPEHLTDQDSQPARTPQPRLRKPNATDGAAIWALVRACKPLDENSLYANIVQADHFRDTSVIAEAEGETLGWISGHMIPNTDTFFVWQVAVSDKARGLGLGRKMLLELLSRPETASARALHTTITPDNAASWALFRSLARSLGGTLTDAPHYTRAQHFDGAHATEHLVQITLPTQRAAA